MNFYCAYCGNQIILEQYPGIDDLLRIKKADIMSKKADAEVIKANAELKDADTRFIKEVHSWELRHPERKMSVLSAILLIVVGLLAMAILLWLYSDEKLNGEVALLIGIWMFIIFLLGVILLMNSSRKYDPIKENEILKLKEKVNKLATEVAEQQKIIALCRGIGSGPNVEVKREAKRRIKELRIDIRMTQNKIGRLEAERNRLW